MYSYGISKPSSLVFKLERRCEARNQFDKNRVTERLNCKEGDRFTQQALGIVVIALEAHFSRRR